VAASGARSQSRRSKQSLNSRSEVFLERFFLPRIITASEKLKETTMRKFILSLAALAALGFVVPYAAPAKAEDTVVIHRGGDRDMHRHHHHKKVIIMKHGDHDHM
jgi:hypothetical protein